VAKDREDPSLIILSEISLTDNNQYPPLVQHLKLQVRMNANKKAVELRTSKHTTDTGALQKGEDFVKAFSLGFDV
jgi:rRNA processing protein Krr1/Pno1